MFQVIKQLDFCYAHRLLDYQGPCARLHGHNGRIEMTLTCDELDERGMVYEFGELKERIGGWINETLDHRTLLREDDPLVSVLEDAGETVFRMQQNPTAEALAALVYRQAQDLGLPVTEVRLWETPRACACYQGT